MSGPGIGDSSYGSLPTNGVSGVPPLPPASSFPQYPHGPAPQPWHTTPPPPPQPQVQKKPRKYPMWAGLALVGVIVAGLMAVQMYMANRSGTVANKDGLNANVVTLVKNQDAFKMPDDILKQELYDLSLTVDERSQVLSAYYFAREDSKSMTRFTVFEASDRKPENWDVLGKDQNISKVGEWSCTANVGDRPDLNFNRDVCRSEFNSWFLTVSRDHLKELDGLPAFGQAFLQAQNEDHEGKLSKVPNVKLLDLRSEGLRLTSFKKSVKIQTDGHVDSRFWISYYPIGNTSSIRSVYMSAEGSTDADKLQRTLKHRKAPIETETGTIGELTTGTVVEGARDAQLAVGYIDDWLWEVKWSPKNEQGAFDRSVRKLVEANS